MKRSTLILMLIFVALLAACGEKSDGPVVVATPSPTIEAAQATPIPASPTPPAESYPMPEPTQTAESDAYPPPLPTARPPDTDYPAAPTPIPPAAQPYPEPSTETPRTEPDLAILNLNLELALGGLDKPIGGFNAGDGSNRLFILEQGGVIRIVNEDDLLNPAPFLDIRDRVTTEKNEQGLLGLAFHPNYADNGFFFVNYSGEGGQTVVSRFSASANPDLADLGSEQVLLAQDQPAGNHNGGNLVFGPDGYLYIGLGDGGGAGDQFGNGQNGQTWLGAMLRIDIDQEPYGAPADNPFVGDPAVRDEIWALGLRNPWRYSFDRLTGDLYIADVGQKKYEELHVQPAGSAGGQNYGWPVLEGSHCYPEDDDSCDKSPYQLPVVEYGHAQGCSIAGGYVYRGSQFPALYGVYLFADLCTGRIWGLVQMDDTWQVEELIRTELQISSFAEDEAGELYVLGMNRGEMHHLVLENQDE